MGSVLVGRFVGVGTCSGLAGCHSDPGLLRSRPKGNIPYAGRCAHCRGENDLNLKRAPPDLHRLFRLTTLPSRAPASDVEVKRVVLAGKGRMTGFTGRFSDEQMAALIAYLRTGISRAGHALAAIPLIGIKGKGGSRAIR